MLMLGFKLSQTLSPHSDRKLGDKTTKAACQQICLGIRGFALEPLTETQKTRKLSATHTTGTFLFPCYECAVIMAVIVILSRKNSVSSGDRSRTRWRLHVRILKHPGGMQRGQRSRSAAAKGSPYRRKGQSETSMHLVPGRSWELAKSLIRSWTTSTLRATASAFICDHWLIDSSNASFAAILPGTYSCSLSGFLFQSRQSCLLSLLSARLMCSTIARAIRRRNAAVNFWHMFAGTYK